MRRRDLLAALGVGLAGCVGTPSTAIDSPTGPPTASPTSGPTPADENRPTATARDPT